MAAKEFYVSDIWNLHYAWVFETREEAEANIELVKIADYKLDPYAIHEYIITEECPF